jgi:hypothetical protein
MIAGIITLFFAGLIDGILEGYGFDGRKSFERKYKVNPLGFWGSKSHLKAYTDPNIYNKLLGVFDFYHVADDLRKGGYILSCILLGYYLDINLILLIIGAYVISAVPKIFGMAWIRGKKLFKKLNQYKMDKVTKLILAATIISFAAGILVTYVDFTKGIELLIFPGVPFSAIGLLIYLSEKGKKAA